MARWGGLSTASGDRELRSNKALLTDAYAPPLRAQMRRGKTRTLSSLMSASARLRAQWRRTLAVALFLFVSISAANDKAAVPRLEGRVTDVANVLSAADRERLTSLLASYEKETSHQIGVLLIPSLAGETIESYSLRVANSWKLGQRGLDNGILVTMAMKERSVRIELGVGFERYISNSKAQAIIANAMVPAFRRGDYAGGLRAGVEELMREGRRFVVRAADLERARQK
jgi:uncharacterized protein